MQAMVLQEFGSSSSFVVADVPTPRVGPGHVLVRVKASSVNPVDCKIRSGALGGLAPAFPAILHGDMAGVVEQIGENVSPRIVGDEVFGFVGGITRTQGVIAEYAVVDARLIARKPAHLSFAQTAALPLVSITAWEALVDKIRVVPGDHVLIHGGVGGVGHIAVQLAKLQGARVAVTVASLAKGDIARQFGADDVILYRDEEVQSYVKRLTNGRGFDVVFDTVGGDVLDKSFEAVRIRGQVASTSTHAQHDLSLLHQKGASLHVVFMLLPLLQGAGFEHHGEVMRRVGEIASRGQLNPLVDTRSFSFSDIGRAHAYLESGASMGKVVLQNDL